MCFHRLINKFSFIFSSQYSVLSSINSFLLILDRNITVFFIENIENSKRAFCSTNFSISCKQFALYSKEYRKNARFWIILNVKHIFLLYVNRKCITTQPSMEYFFFRIIMQECDSNFANDIDFCIQIRRENFRFYCIYV